MKFQKLIYLIKLAGFQKFSSQYKIIVIGAVHISEALVKIANVLNFKVFLIDPRTNFDEKRFKEKATLLKEWPDEGLKN